MFVELQDEKMVVCDRKTDLRLTAGRLSKYHDSGIETVWECFMEGGSERLLSQALTSEACATKQV